MIGRPIFKKDFHQGFELDHGQLTDKTKQAKNLAKDKTKGSQNGNQYTI